MFTIQPSIGLIVYLHSLKYIRNLRSFGRLYYVSKRMRYAIIYVQQEDEASTVKKLSNLNYVRQVVPSKLNDLLKEIQGKDPTTADKESDEDFED